MISGQRDVNKSYFSIDFSPRFSLVKIFSEAVCSFVPNKKDGFWRPLGVRTSKILFQMSCHFGCLQLCEL